MFRKLANTRLSMFKFDFAGFFVPIKCYRRKFMKALSYSHLAFFSGNFYKIPGSINVSGCSIHIYNVRWPKNNGKCFNQFNIVPYRIISTQYVGVDEFFIYLFINIQQPPL